tara:strand:- start:1053 stop:2546 length:1494 start_codon:yes stop_codon:yes gene_type:complete
MFNADQALMEKWAPVLNHDGVASISSPEKKAITARLLENTEVALQEEAAAQSYQGLSETTVAGSTSSFNVADPVLISLVRRAMPNLVAYDICGVQPMTGPTGLIFAMTARQGNAGRAADSSAIDNTDTEAFRYNPVSTHFSGTGSGEAGTPELQGSLGSSLEFDGTATATVGDTYIITALNNSTVADLNSVSEHSQPSWKVGDTFVASATGAALSDRNPGATYKLVVAAATYATGTGDSTTNFETETQFQDMGFTIEKTTVTAVTRALKAEYTMELAQDLKAVHGLDAETELANILSAEILAEINREVIRTINQSAKPASTSPAASSGIIDMSADVGGGRYFAEKFKGLAFRIEQEANRIARDTNRGKGNFVLCSSGVASALGAAGAISNYATDAGGLNVDNAGNTFAGTLASGIKVYVDPYAANDYFTVGYKGANSYDAGLFYCPYVPLTMVKAVGENTFQPKIGFKTRYGMQVNPLTASGDRVNEYYRLATVTNL